MSENVKQLAITHNKRGNLEASGGGGQLRPRMTRKVYLSYPVFAIVFRSSLKGEKRRLGDNDNQRKKSFVRQKQVFILQVSRSRSMLNT